MVEESMATSELAAEPFLSLLNEAAQLSSNFRRTNATIGGFELFHENRGGRIPVGGLAQPGVISVFQMKEDDAIPGSETDHARSP